MPELVALDLVAGPGFVDALRSAWEVGDAVLPVDPRLPGPAVARLLETLRPTVVVDGTGRHRRPGGQPVDPGDALVVATSGTTGEPKGVVLDHPAVEASARATSRRLEVDRGTDRWVACLPLAHVGGLSVVTRSLITGTPCTVLPAFDAVAVERLSLEGCTLISLVATALRRDRHLRVPGRAAGRCSTPRWPARQRRHHVRHDRDGLGHRLRRQAARRGGGTDRRRVHRPGRRDPGPRSDAAPRLPRRHRPTAPGRMAPHRRRGAVGARRITRRVRTVGRGHRHRRGEGLAGTGGTGARYPSAASIRWPCGSGPTPSGASGWWPGSSRATVPGPPGSTRCGTWLPSELPRWAGPRELVMTDRLPRNAGGKVTRTSLA